MATAGKQGSSDDTSMIFLSNLKVETAERRAFAPTKTLAHCATLTVSGEYLPLAVLPAGDHYSAGGAGSGVNIAFR